MGSDSSRLRLINRVTRLNNRLNNRHIPSLKRLQLLDYNDSSSKNHFEVSSFFWTEFFKKFKINIYNNVRPKKKSLVREFYSLTKYLFINIFFFYLKVFKLKIKIAEI